MTRDARAGTALVVALCAAAGCRGPAPEAPIARAATLAETGGSRPTAAVDGDGTAYVAWVGTNGGSSDVWLGRVGADGGALGDPVRVNDVPGDAAPHGQAPAQVGVGPGGEVYVAWQNNTVVEGRRFPASDLRFARSLDGGRSFEPAISVPDYDHRIPASFTFHDLVVGPDGAVYVSWLDSRNAWMAAGEGAVESDQEGGPQIRVAVSTDRGATFGPGVVVDEETCPCCRTALAAGPGGVVYVAWRKVFPGDVRDVVVARSEDGGRTFDAPVKVQDDGWVFSGCPHAGPSLAVDPEGTLHATWYTGRDGANGLFYTRSEDGGRTFAPASPLLADAWVPPSQAQVLSSGDGLWLAWEERRHDTPRFYVMRVEGAAAVRPEGAVSMPGEYPDLATRFGVGAVAWLEGERVRAGMLEP